VDVDSSALEEMGVGLIIRQHIIVKVVTGLLLAGFLVNLGCANKVLKYEHAEQLKVNDEFDKAVKIEEVHEEPVVDSSTGEKLDTKKTIAPKKKTKKKKKISATLTPLRRQPEIESDLGFEGRRPIVDPFRVGERVVHSVKYFKMSAGKMTFEVKPLVTVNGRKSYNFRTAVKTSSFFESFYAVDDFVETLVDFENLVPNVFTLHVQETGQIKETRSYFDQNKLKATFWEKKVTAKDGKEEKKMDWEIAPFSQNVFSIIFYLRNFQWAVGSENAFSVSDDGKNLVFKGKALRKEHITTDAGEFNAIVIKPEVTLEGKFQPVGDVFIWLSDDDRKFLLRIESKIKIGTLVSEVVELVPGG
jgi:hypothetical protein